MTTTLTMPVVGETVTEGRGEGWLKKPGDHVDKYEPIVEINTDKVDVELPSPVTGTVKELLAEGGAGGGGGGGALFGGGRAPPPPRRPRRAGGTHRAGGGDGPSHAGPPHHSPADGGL